MKKALTAIVLIIALVMVIALPVEADTKYIEKQFVFGSYAPQIRIINAALGTALEVRTDGSVCWKKLRDNTDYNDVSQSFLIVPAGSGYYRIEEMLPMGGHNPRVLTYNPGKGFAMDWPENGKISDTQKFRFKWYSSTTCGGRTIKNCWRLVCKKDNVAFCRSGWGTVKFLQMNA